MEHAIGFGEDPADVIVGIAGVSAGDESVNHDHYLYGWPKAVVDFARDHDAPSSEPRL